MTDLPSGQQPRCARVYILLQRVYSLIAAAMLLLMAFRKMSFAVGGRRITIQGHPGRLLLCFSVVWLLTVVWQRKAQLLRTGLDVPLLLLLAVAGLSSALSPFSESSRDLINLCAEVLFFYGLVALVRIRAHTWGRRRELVIWALLLSGAASVVVGLAIAPNGISDWCTGDRLAQTPMGNPNRLGAYLCLLFPVGVGLTAAAHRCTGYAWRLAILVPVGFGLVFTGSCGSWLGALAGLVCWVLLSEFKNPVLRGVAVAGVILVLFVSVPGAFRRWTPLLDDTTHLHERTELSDVGLRTRLIWWGDAARLIRQYPVLGIGFGRANSRAALCLARASGNTAPDLPPAPHAHNAILEVWLQMGPMGLILAFWLLTRVVRDLWRVRRTSGDHDARRLASSVIAGLAAIFVAGLFDSVILHDRINLAVWALLAVAEIGGRPKPP